MRYTLSAPFLTRAAFSILLLGGAFGTTSCDVERTQQGKAPDIDVDVDPGRWPEYDVNWADVDVGTTTRTVTVPKLQVIQEEETVEVPYIDIKGPNATDMEDRTVRVELEVPNAGYDVRIREVRAAGDTLWVISELTRRDAPAAQAITRVSDQLVVRAPEDLDIRKVVIGERPEGVYNQQHMFVNDRAALDQRLPQGGRVIYSANGQGAA